MTRAEALSLLARIAGVYARFRPNEEASADWCMALADATKTEVVDRWHAWIRESPFPPTPADLIGKKSQTAPTGPVCECGKPVEPGGILCERHAAACRTGFVVGDTSPREPRPIASILPGALKPPQLP